MRFCILVLAVSLSWAQESNSRPAVALFSEHVRPVLEKRCLPCHGGAAKRSGFDLSTRESLLRGGDRGPAVIPGDPKGSMLYRLIGHEQEPHMPHQAAKLAEPLIGEIAEWIKGGAPYDSPLGPGPAARNVPPAGRTHWAFQPPKRAAVPSVKNRVWAEHPIDSFLAAEHEKLGLKPNPPASKNALLRRVYLDLTGLPPTREELRAFLADRSKDAYQKVIEQLLASPRYGERWGRHWMDIWRYSDWYGWRKQNDVRYSQRHIWRWRDWIIDSVNEDKGYDRMVVEMLAGDELAPDDPKTVRATGYLARSWYKFNRNTWLQDTVEHTAAGFLGVTLKCARCHDHKYDPISQEEYYRFRAFFETHDIRTDRVQGQPDLNQDGLPRAYDDKTAAETFLLIRGNENTPDKDKPLSPGFPRILGKGEPQIEPVPLSLETYYPDFRPFVHKDLVDRAKADIEKFEAALAKAGEEVRTAKQQEAAASTEESQPKLKKAEAAAALAQKELDTARTTLPAVEARIAADKAKFRSPPDPQAEALALIAKKLEHVASLAKVQEALLRVEQQLTEPKSVSDPDDKEAQKKLAEARKQLKTAQDALEARVDYTPIGKRYPDSSTGRRLTLARWMASKDNPLTARVAVNHIWSRHFGKPLVPTVDNFGMNGKSATHPDLLDWLALEFMEKGWSMKAIHRLIVSSNAYRMASSTAKPAQQNIAIDPDNCYLWRMNLRRMEAEIVRDSVLHVAGRLDTTMGGPELDESTGETNRRRSVYFRHAPDAQMLFLKIFDAANPIESYTRGESVVPQQALAMVNSKLTNSIARELAGDLSKKVARAANTEFLTGVFETMIGRTPSAAELAESIRFLRQQEELLQKPEALKVWQTGKPADAQIVAEPYLRARENLVHALFSHNEFLTIP